jgi:hypothetical protein
VSEELHKIPKDKRGFYEAHRQDESIESGFKEKERQEKSEEVQRGAKVPFLISLFGESTFFPEV